MPSSRTRRRIEVEQRVYDLLRQYAASRAMSVAGATHVLLLAALEQHGLSLPGRDDLGAAAGGTRQG